MAPKTRSVWGVRRALYLSLALNLLVLGVLIGSAVTGRGPGGPRNFELGLGPLVQALQPEDRRAVADRLRDRAGVRDLRPEARRALTADLARAIGTEPFDRDGIEAMLDAQATRAAEGLTLARAAFLDRIEAMTPQERAAYAERLLREGSRRPPPAREGD